MEKYICSVGSDQDGKVGSVVFFPSPICKESFLPCHPTPSAQSFLLSIKQTYWHRAGCRQGKGFHHYFDPVHQVTMFFPLSGVASGRRRYPHLGLRPRAHLYGCACPEQRAKQACQETKALRYSEVEERQFPSGKVSSSFSCISYLLL